MFVIIIRVIFILLFAWFLYRLCMYPKWQEADLYYLLAHVYKNMKRNINYNKYIKLAYQYKSTFTGNIKKLEDEIEDTKK